MARTIQIDTDTLVGYSYILKKYYVTNKDTTTYRSGVEDTLNVLRIVAPATTVTKEELELLASALEPLLNLYYTLEDNGSYVRTIQINDYEDNPITIDCEKKKLYIMNTNLVFDLTLSENRESRVAQIQAYFRDTLGISITTEQLLSIYNFLISFYIPCVYNGIENLDNSNSNINTTNSTITYSNRIYLSNFLGSGKAEYVCTCNPSNSYTPINIGNIVATDSTTNTITLTNNSLSLQEGDHIIISNAKYEDSYYSLSADGDYTVKSITNNIVTTNEVIPYSYEFPYIQCYSHVSPCSIESINRNDMSITLTNEVPNSILVGDIIQVTGTQTEEEGVTVSCDGEYTVGSISNNIIYVQEVPLTNYTHEESSPSAILYKKVLVGDILEIHDNTITFTNTITVQDNATIEIGNALYTVLEHTSNSIKVDTVAEYSPVYPQLQFAQPYTNILTTVYNTTNEEIFPNGDFMVDNFEECQQYMKLMFPSTMREGEEVLDPCVPTMFHYNLVNKVVPSIYPKEVVENMPLLFKGLYSRIYYNN